MFQSVRWVLSLLLMTAAGTVVGQQPFPQGEEEIDPFRIPRTTSLARTKFGVTRATPSDLARDRFGYARKEFESRFQELLAGRGTLDFVLAASLRWLDAELALAESPAARQAAYERYWLFAWQVELINKARNDAGRLPIQDYLHARYYRLDAEIKLHEARARNKSAKTLVLRGLELLDNDGAFPFGQNPSPDLIEAERKERARGKFESLRSDPRQLLQAKGDTVRNEIEAIFKEFLAGRGTLSLTISPSRRLLQSELESAENDSARLAAYERYCHNAQEDAAINKARFEAARIPIQDHAWSQYHRLEAEIWLARASQLKGRRQAPVETTQLGNRMDDISRAQARWEAAHQPFEVLLQHKLEAASTEFEARWKEFLAGRGTLEFLLSAALRVLESEQAVNTKPFEHLAALDRHFAWMSLIDEVNTGRFESGRIPVQDYAEARYFRLDAEIKLLQARAKAKNQ